MSRFTVLSISFGIVFLVAENVGAQTQVTSPSNGKPIQQGTKISVNGTVLVSQMAPTDKIVINKVKVRVKNNTTNTFNETEVPFTTKKVTVDEANFVQVSIQTGKICTVPARSANMYDDNGTIWIIVNYTLNGNAQVINGSDSNMHPITK